MLPKQQEKIERKSRYIAQLKEQAEQRKREEVCVHVMCACVLVRVFFLLYVACVCVHDQ